MLISKWFGKALRIHRAYNCLSQTEAAQLCGVSRITWSKYENGHMEPTLSFLDALLSAGFDLDYLLGRQNEEGQYGQYDQYKEKNRTSRWPGNAKLGQAYRMEGKRYIRGAWE